MKKAANFRKYSIYALMLAGVVVTSCKKDDDDDEPAKENEVEVITDISLVFTNVNDASDVVIATAQDPDGEGVEELQIVDEITLDVDKTYTLTLEIMNNLDSPGESITEEIEEEDEDHQFFYSFTDNAFSSPAGDGNIDNSGDLVNYNDYDSNGNPVGLSTEWTTSSTTLTAGSFRFLLKHQPDIKSATSGSDDGETDIDLTFVLNIQ